MLRLYNACMDVSPSVRSKLVRSIVALSELCEGKPRELRALYEVCVALSDYADDDDYSVAHDLQDYMEECLKVAEGNGDPQWRQQLLETLEDDMDEENI